jgi:rapamycin-insensitive companion of mTOR
MKSRPEYKPVFSSSAMLYRALHTISTSKYRQPVRRYILDLFNLELDGDTVAALAAWSKRLRTLDGGAPAEQDQRSSRLTNPRVLSIYTHRRPQDMDEESASSDEDGMAVPGPSVRKRGPVVTRPLSRIVGFAQ